MYTAQLHQVYVLVHTLHTCIYYQAYIDQLHQVLVRTLSSILIAIYIAQVHTLSSINRSWSIASSTRAAHAINLILLCKHISLNYMINYIRTLSRIHCSITSSTNAIKHKLITYNNSTWSNALSLYMSALRIVAILTVNFSTLKIHVPVKPSAHITTNLRPLKFRIC